MTDATPALLKDILGPQALDTIAGAGAAASPHFDRPAFLSSASQGLDALSIMERVRQLAAEKGWTDDPDHPDTLHRLNMGVFPEGATLIPNPYNRIPGFSVGDVHFVPGFPVMAHPMIEALLDTRYAHLHGAGVQQERSLIVYGAMEASLTPLMIDLEARFEGIKVFSLPSVDHPVHGRHIELGVKGRGERLDAAYAALLDGLARFGARTGPEMVRSNAPE